MTFERYSNTRVLIGLTEFLEDIGESTLICVNKGVLGALRVLIRSYGLRQINWVDTHTLAGYTTPSPANFDIIDEKISEFLEETNMTTCDDLVTALQSIAASLAEGCCQTGQEGRGSRGTDGADSPETGSFDDGSNVPPGFPDRPAYEVYKCNQANLIFSDWLDDTGWLKLGTISTLIASSLVVALLTPIPGDEILLFLGLALTLLAQGLLVGVAANIITAVTADQNNLVCNMYNAFDVDAARTFIETWASSNLTAIEEQFFLFFLSNDALNRLFVYNAADSNRMPGMTPTDCDDCASCDQRIFTRGAEPVPFTMTSEWTGGNTQIIVYFNTNSASPTDTCGPEVKGIPTFNFGSADHFILWDNTGTIIYNEVVVWTDPELSYQLAQIELEDFDVPFELDYQYEDAF